MHLDTDELCTLHSNVPFSILFKLRRNKNTNSVTAKSYFHDNTCRFKIDLALWKSVIEMMQQLLVGC